MWVIDKSSCSTLTYLQSTILGCWMKIRKNVHILLILVRFLVLVTTMVTKVDHGNHRSNDRGNNRSNHLGYYDRYFDGNSFFLQDNSAFPSFSYYDGNQG